MSDRPQESRAEVWDRISSELRPVRECNWPYQPKAGQEDTYNYTFQTEKTQKTTRSEVTDEANRQLAGSRTQDVSVQRQVQTPPEGQ